MLGHANIDNAIVEMPGNDGDYDPITNNCATFPLSVAKNLGLLISEDIIDYTVDGFLKSDNVMESVNENTSSISSMMMDNNGYNLCRMMLRYTPRRLVHTLVSGYVAKFNAAIDDME